MIFIRQILALLIVFTAPIALADDPNSLLSLLEQKKYLEIEKRISDAAQQADRSATREPELTNLLDQFYTPQASLEQQLNAWVQARGASYIPYLARGIHLDSMGWSHRGTKYISETSGKQLDGMQFYFEKSYKDFAKSLEIEPRQASAQLYMIEIAMNYGDRELPEKLYRHALAHRPNSLAARWYYLSSLLPRWGGTLDQMSSVIKASRALHQANPNLKVLEGRISAEQGDQAYFAGQYAEAMNAYKQALSTGEHWYYLKQQGEVLLRTGQLEASVNSLSKAISQRPAYWRAYDQRGVAYQAMGKHVEAIRDFTVAIRNAEGGSRLINARGESYLALNKSREALRDFEEALKQDPSNTDYISNRDKAKSLPPSR